MVIRFELPPDILSSASIISAVLSLYRFSGDNVDPASPDFMLVPAEEGWSEMSVTSDNRPMHYPHLAFDEAPSETDNSWLDLDATEAIQEHVMDPDTNKGFIVVSYTAGNWIDLRSSEYETVELRPKLVINYDNDPVSITNQHITMHDNIKVREIDGTLKVDYPYSGTYKINIFSISGQKINSYTLSGNTQSIELPGPGTSGTFIVQLIHHNTSIMKKVNVIR